MPSVNEVIEKIREVGLEVRRNPARGSHTLWDVVDPTTGTIITGISAHADRRGGDRNWHFNIRRVLRRAGFQIEFGEVKRKGRPIRQTGRNKPAVDLEALKKAQDAAAAAGHRVPLLDDLEEHPEFLRKSAGQSGGYTSEAQQEKIEHMAPKAEAPRFRASVARLRTMLDAKEDELIQRVKDRATEEGRKFSSPSAAGTARSEFVRIAIEEVAPARNLRAWKSEQAGKQALYTILEQDKGAALWAINLIEATMDHLDGLKWNEIDPDRIKAKVEETLETPPQVGPHDPSLKQPAESKPTDVDATLTMLAEFETKLSSLETEIHNLQASVDYLETGVSNPIAEQYGSVLLDLLKNFNVEQQGNAMLDLIFTRLDKLAGI